ncbi:MAG: zinc-binding dehydrogenase [Solirubrobacteraceae bacterium]|nr:zinc-binding dehydrogenase [Solirubrobacteraceae bacterium]
MRAAYIESYGQTPSIRDLPEPEGELAVGKVLAAGINPVDLMISGGEYYAIRPKPPYTPGLEGVAEREDGSRVYFGRPGDLKHGSLAEQLLLDPAECFDLPDGTDPATAIGCGIAGIAAYLSVMDRGAIQAGEKVIVTGATGAAGRLAVQLAKNAGAAQVIAVGRNAEALEQVKALGADETVRFHGPLYMHQVDLRDLTDGGADLIIDFTWGAPAMAALNCAAKDARLIQVGNAASLGVGVSATELRRGNFVIKGYSNWNETLERKQEAFTELLGQVAAGTLKLHTEAVGLDDVPSAWERQATSPGAKLVVVTD